MNYEKIYKNIIKNAKDQHRSKGSVYYELHHILPRSIGGNNTKENLVLLTPREHFLCHRLLIEIYKNDRKKYLSMIRAFIMISTKNEHQSRRYINSRLYEKIKNNLYGRDGLLTGPNSTFYNKEHSQVTRDKMSESKKGQLNPQYGKIPWNKGKNKTSDNRIKEYADKQRNNAYNNNRPEITTETRFKLSLAAKKSNLGKFKSDSHKKSISKKIKELLETNPAYKQQLLDNSKKAAMLTRGKPKEKVKCPHCGKIGGKPAMSRYHFDKCKEK